MKSAQVSLYVGVRLMYSGDLAKPIEFGRESDADGGQVYTRQTQNGNYRVAMADKEYTDMSRRLVMITPLDNGHIRVENLSRSNHVHIETQDPLWPKQSRELPIPAVLTAFDRRIEISAKGTAYDTLLLSMDQPMSPPGSEDEADSAVVSSNLAIARNKLSGEVNDQILQWLGAVTRVLQSALGSVDFYERAAKEMVDLIGLDSGRVLELGGDGNWSVVASFHRSPTEADSANWSPVSHLLRQVLQDKRTYWSSPSEMSVRTDSTRGVMVVLAAPLLDQEGNVIGALYGDRRTEGTHEGEDEGLGMLEAMLVETLARGVAAGRARVEQERNAATAQVRFEQFFTPELSRHLATNPDLLTRRDSDVTLLFCDIRRFSSISEQLGPEVTMEWLSEVMGSMAECAVMYDGTLVDYIGDELMVMWGAPAPQQDHAMRACQAALRMARRLGELDKKWREQIGQPTDLGFGINSGSARVGNVGFEKKFRYAPFGNTVNIASRVQGATKYLGATVIVTEATYKQLETKPLARRLCRARVVNIEEPILLYELCADESAATQQLCQEYEKALKCFEEDNLAQAIHILSEILRTHQTDGPTILLLSRAVECLLKKDGDFDRVFDLPGK